MRDCAATLVHGLPRSRLCRSRAAERQKRGCRVPRLKNWRRALVERWLSVLLSGFLVEGLHCNGRLGFPSIANRGSAATQAENQMNKGSSFDKIAPFGTFSTYLFLPTAQEEHRFGAPRALGLRARLACCSCRGYTGNNDQPDILSAITISRCMLKTRRNCFRVRVPRLPAVG